MIERVDEVFNAPFRVNARDIYTTISTGISIYPVDGLNAEDIINHAELALSQARGYKGNSFHFYSKDLDRVAHEALLMESRIRKALENDEFILYYQPKFDLRTQKIVGMEALIRWRNPDEGLILPYKFIPILEETGMIMRVGDWLLKEVCRQVKRLNENGNNLRVSLNVSPVQLRGDLADALIRAVEETRVRPEGLEIEITETALMEDIERNIERLRRLKDYGINIALDDFGKGYSSLSHLKDLPISSLKMDGSFTRCILYDERCRKMTRLIISLAKAFDLKTVAECIETKGELDFLVENGCDEGQGYYFCRPMPLEDLQGFIRGLPLC